jgi:hypothetical protein
VVRALEAALEKAVTSAVSKDELSGCHTQLTALNFAVGELKANVGPDRIVALYHRPSSLYQTHLQL